MACSRAKDAYLNPVMAVMGRRRSGSYKSQACSRWLRAAPILPRTACLPQDHEATTSLADRETGWPKIGVVRSEQRTWRIPPGKMVCGRCEEVLEKLEIIWILPNLAAKLDHPVESVHLFGSAPAAHPDQRHKQAALQVKLF